MTEKGPRSRSQALLLLFGGILPVVAFALVEDRFGTVWGTIAGMIFGLGEILYEKFRIGRVSGVTWFANALILVLGAVSLVSQDGLWFKLQPALFFASFGLVLIGSSVLKKPLLLAMALKQNPGLPPAAARLMNGLNFRLGLLFLFMAGLSAWAALHWTTEAWAFLKGVGVFIILGIYLAGEIAYRRYRQN